jgi:hypothetical protein
MAEYREIAQRAGADAATITVKSWFHEMFAGVPDEYQESLAAGG